MSVEQEVIDNLIKRQINILRLDASLRKDILKYLRELEKEIIFKLTDEDTFSQIRLRKLFKEVSNLIEDTYNLINETNLEYMSEISSLEQSEVISDMKKIKISALSIPPEKLNYIVKNSLIGGAPSKEWWSRQSVSLSNKFKDQVRIGVTLGENNQNIIKRIRGSRDFNYTNGIMNTSRREAEALVRTSVQTAANETRMSIFENNSKLFTKYRHVSTLDGRTSLQCIVRDGKEWDSKTKKPINHNIPFQTPPIHFNCRSTIIVITPLFNFDNVKRASEDGPVPSSTTFEDFLKRKNKSEVEKLLGKGRADLYLNGKITLNQLLDQSNNPLTLKQLKEKYV